jgi:hypothetical protein
MGGAPLIIPLVALVIPIALLLFAILFDAAVLVWAAYRTWHDRIRPQLVVLEERALVAAHVVGRRYAPRLVNHR